MNRRDRMYETNKKAKKWLLDHEFDYIWFKPHHDSRKKKHKETYTTKQGVFYQTDLYNLFDGICFDNAGNVVFLQMSTGKFHPVKKYEDFFMDKDSCYCVLLCAVKNKNRWEIRTKYVYPPQSLVHVEENRT